MNRFPSNILRQFLCLSIVFFAAVGVSAQSSAASQPQPILFGSWSEPVKTAPAPAAQKPQPILFATISQPERQASPVQSSVLAHRVERARIVGAVKANAAAPAFNVQPTALESEAFDLINEQRRLQNLPALRWDAGMLHIARQHSENMSKLDFFSHLGRDGLTADGRARAAGIGDWQRIGENIAFSQGAKNRVELAVECWMKSEGHRRNILGQSWSRAGIGVAVTADGKFYITQVFRN